MYTQMVMDQDLEKVYIYDQDDDTDGVEFDKLQTIMEGGSDISSRFVDTSRMQSEYVSACYSRKHSVDSKLISRPTDRSLFKQKASFNSDDIPMVRGSSHYSIAKDRDEVNFSFDSQDDKKQCNKVYLRSNSVSPSSSPEDSPESTQSPDKLQRSFSDGKLKGYSENSDFNISPKSTEKLHKSNSTADDLVQDYVIISKKPNKKFDAKAMADAFARKRSQSPCFNIDDDEITIVEFTKSNCIETISDCGTDKSVKNTKPIKQMQKWESKVFINYGVKQVSVDLSNTEQDDEAKENSDSVIQVVSRQPSSEELLETNRPKDYSKIINFTK